MRLKGFLKAFFVFETLALAFPAQALNKAYLMIAVDSDSTQPYYRFSGHRNRTEELTALFHQRLKAFPLERIVVNRASQEDLATALQNKDTVALFWVGHSNKGTDSPVGIEPIITDIYGNNVAPLFQRLHSNLRWLAIIGCRAEPILEQYRNLGFYKRNKLLRTFAYSTLIEESIGLSQATFASYLYLGAMEKAYPNYVCDANKPNSQALTLQRMAPVNQGGSEFQVFINGRFFKSFARAQPSEVQQQTIWVSKEFSQAQSFSVQIRASGNPVFGEITVTGKNKIVTHQVVRRRDGVPMGHTQRVLLPTAQLAQESFEQQPSECETDQSQMY